MMEGPKQAMSSSCCQEPHNDDIDWGYHRVQPYLVSSSCVLLQYSMPVITFPAL